MGTPLAVSDTFTDPDAGDTHAAVWVWGDGTSGDGTVDEAGGLVSGSHAYAGAGVFTVTLTITDAAGLSDQASSQYLVIFDPTGSFVTGGGWIESPPGAYVAEPSLTGRAHFGFVSRYEKGATVPSGKTEFRFQSAGLDFTSTAYQWLVVAGPHAKFKGTGTIEGLPGEFGFMVTATDGNIHGGGDADSFRIKIWDMATAAVVYDNQLGDDELADATDAIEGGAITIHLK